MDAIAAVLVALLSAYVPVGFECEIVEAGPTAIEMFCDNPDTNGLRFVLIERTGNLLIVDGLSL